jgi:FKBP-type peptidyl-prolyl cis-trans isomerase
MHIHSLFRAGICATICLGFLPAEPRAGSVKKLEDDKHRMSYALGVDLGKSLRERSVDLDPAIFAQGLQDALSGAKPLLTDEEVRSAIMDLKVQQKNKMFARQRQQSDEYLAANKKKPGVVARDSGLQYKVLHEGKGKRPAPDDVVVCHYRGIHIDGSEFDNTYQRNQPVTFRVDGAVKAWVEALQLMPEGSKWEIVVPPGLAVTGRGGSSLATNAVIFELELVSIKKKS